MYLLTLESTPLKVSERPEKLIGSAISILGNYWSLRNTNGIHMEPWTTKDGLTFRTSFTVEGRDCCGNEVNSDGNSLSLTIEYVPEI